MKRHPSSLASAISRQLSAALGRFSRVRVLVIGDLMLDQYIWGQVERISPEAPVPVVRVTRESLHAGGAGNVAANIRSLGGSVVTCGVIGKDQAGHRLQQELRAIGASTIGVLTNRAMTTTSKTRIIAHNQQVVRLDREQSENLDLRVRSQLRRFVQQQVQDCDVVVVSDYGKGVIDADLLEQLAALREHQRFIYVTDPSVGTMRTTVGQPWSSLTKKKRDKPQESTFAVRRVCNRQGCACLRSGRDIGRSDDPSQSRRRYCRWESWNSDCDPK